MQNMFSMKIQVQGPCARMRVVRESWKTGRRQNAWYRYSGRLTPEMTKDDDSTRPSAPYALRVRDGKVSENYQFGNGIVIPTTGPVTHMLATVCAPNVHPQSCHNPSHAILSMYRNRDDG